MDLPQGRRYSNEEVYGFFERESSSSLDRRWEWGRTMRVLWRVNRSDFLFFHCISLASRTYIRLWWMYKARKEGRPLCLWHIPFKFPMMKSYMMNWESCSGKPLSVWNDIVREATSYYLFGKGKTKQWMYFLMILWVSSLLRHPEPFMHLPYNESNNSQIHIQKPNKKTICFLFRINLYFLSYMNIRGELEVVEFGIKKFKMDDRRSWGSFGHSLHQSCICRIMGVASACYYVIFTHVRFVLQCERKNQQNSFYLRDCHIHRRVDSCCRCGHASCLRVLLTKKCSQA